MDADDNLVNMPENSLNEEGDATEKVGSLSEIDLLRWENSLLKREKELREREKYFQANREGDLETGEAQSSASNNTLEVGQFKMGIREVSVLISEFNPSIDKNITAANWIESIEGLKDVYSWDDRSTLFYASLRLGGAAIQWYQSRQDFIKTWEKFKEELPQSFPTGQDDATILLKIIERKRLPGECVEDYLYSIAALARKINLKESSTIKYIISGLVDQNLVNVLMASNCKTIPTLLMQIKEYEEIRAQGRKRGSFLSNYGEGTSRQHKPKPHRFYPYNKSGSEPDNLQKKFKWESKRQEGATNQIKSINNKVPIKCFRCNEPGHYVRQCPHKNIKCFECNQTGHIARECKNKGVSNIRAINEISEYPTDEYHVIATVHDKPILAFLDLGSERTTIKHDEVLRYNWSIEACSVVLCGFGGSRVQVIGKIRKELAIEGVSSVTDIMVVRDDAQTVPMIIGKNFLDRPNIKIIKQWGKFQIYENTEDSNIQGKAIKESVSNDVLVCTASGESKTTIEIGDVLVNEEVSLSEKLTLVEIINKFRDCFATTIKEIGRTNLAEMSIKLKEEKIVKYNPYKVPYGLKSELRKRVDELLELDIIKPSTSEYASPVLLVPKKNGEYRMCVDFRKLNSITQRENFPVPNIEETLNSLAGKSVFTTLDLMSGYYQVPIEEKSQHLTAFVTPEGHFEFKRVPFGLTNSPAVFMRLMSKLMRNIGHGKIIVYMDDILIPTESITSNLEIVTLFLTELQKAGVTLNLSKCVFFQSKINFLGHEISKTGVKPGLTKIAAVENFKRPQNIKEVRQFLGLAGYFRRFVSGFSKIALPLNELLKKDKDFEWTHEREKAFTELKRILSGRPVLTLYENEAEHELHTDASSHGLAGILLQRGKDNLLKPVSFFSRATTPSESKYHSYELEALAVVESLERFKHYLLHKRFKIVTDCNSLRMTQEKKDLIPRIARWWMKIAEYNFELVFRPGKQMAHVDALSRSPNEPGEESKTVTDDMLAIGVSQEDWVATLQEQDARLMEIKKVLEGVIENHVDKDGIKGNYIIQSGRLYKKTPQGHRFVVPNGIRWRVIKAAHDDMGHCGVSRTLENLRKTFWFTNMKTVVTKYVNSCIDCLYNKRGSDESRYQLHVPERQPIPFYTVHLDHLGPFPKSSRGNVYLIGMIDSFTKFIVLKAVRSTTTRGVIKLLEEVTQYFGVPTRLVSDKGTAFTSKEFGKYCKENCIKHIQTAVRTPRANGQIERYFRTVKTALATSTQDINGRDWDKNVPAIQWALNSSTQSTTRKTPQELLMAYKPKNILQNKLLMAVQEECDDDSEEDIPLAELREKILQQMSEKQNKGAQKFNSSHKPPKRYLEGDLVLVKQEPASTGQSRKVLPKYRGPYEIKAILGNDRYVVGDTRMTQITQKPYESTHAADNLKPWCKLENLKFDDDEPESEMELE